MWLILFFATTVFAQTSFDTTEIKRIQEDLPDFTGHYAEIEKVHLARQVKYRPLKLPRYWDEIEVSGIKTVAISPGVRLVSLEAGKSFITRKMIYAHTYRMPDEQDFLYLIDRKKQIRYKVLAGKTQDLTEITNLYEPPHYFQTEKPKLTDEFYDKKLLWNGQISGGVQILSADFVKDLLNDSKSQLGYGPRVFGAIMSDWKLPFQAGLMFQFDQAQYRTSYSGNAHHSTMTIGPMVKTKSFQMFENNWKAVGQVRNAIYSRLIYNSNLAKTSFDFNSTQVFLGLEHHWPNEWGEWALTMGYEFQWWNIKSQQDPVDLESSQKTNKAFIVMIGQVF